MPKNRTGFIIATYEGLQVDWSVIMAAIAAVTDGKVWPVVAQWLTILALSQLTIKAKRKKRAEITQ